jgi:hypothetical protein
MIANAESRSQARPFITRASAHAEIFQSEGENDIAWQSTLLLVELESPMHEETH